MCLITFHQMLILYFLNDRKSNIVYSVLLDLFDCVERHSVSWMGQIHSWRPWNWMFLRLSNSRSSGSLTFLLHNKVLNLKFNLTIFINTVTYVTCIFFFDYCVPLLIISYCYYHIVRAIFHHEKELREQAKKMNVTSLRSNTDQNAQSAEMRIAKVAMLNISLWVIMWTPYAAICLQGIYGNQDKITPLVTVLPAIIAKASSISNPIIYAISHPKYRLVHLSWFLFKLIIYIIVNYAFFRLFKRNCHGSALMKSNRPMITSQLALALLPLKKLFILTSRKDKNWIYDPWRYFWLMRRTIKLRNILK